MATDNGNKATRNVEIEQAILGSLLLNNDTFDRIRHITKYQHFYDPLHQRIFEAIRRRIIKDQAATPTILGVILAADPALTEIGGNKYFATLAASVVAASQIKDHADLLREIWMRREMSAALEAGQEAIHDPESDMAEVAGRVEGQFMVMNDLARPDDRAVSFLVAGMGMLDALSDAYQSDGVPGEPMGIDEIDRETGGMMNPEIIVIGARPSMGKTAIALHMARHLAQTGRGCIFHSLEMDPPALVRRVVSSMAKIKGHDIPYLDIRNGRVTEEQFRLIAETVQEFEALPLEITPPSIRSIGALLAESRAARKKMAAKGIELGAIVVDYIQLVEADGKEEPERIANAMKGMKALATQNNCPVIVLAQLNRNVESRAGAGTGSIPRPQMSDLKGSGSIEQDADMIMLLHRDEYYVDRMTEPKGNASKMADHIALKEACKGQLEIILDKFRNGARKTVKVEIDLSLIHI